MSSRKRLKRSSKESNKGLPWCKEIRGPSKIGDCVGMVGEEVTFRKEEEEVVEDGVKEGGGREHRKHRSYEQSGQ